MNKKTNQIAIAGMIAAIYVVLTFVANVMGLANYAVQVRFSEALTILPALTFAAVPGVSVGCLLANIITGCALPDIIFGTIATVIGAFGTYALRKTGNKWLYPVPPILANTIIVPLILIYGYDLRLEGVSDLYTYFYYAATVGAGEIISCGILGLLLYAAISKRKGQLGIAE